MFHRVLGPFWNNSKLLRSPCHSRRNLGILVRAGNEIPVNGMEATKGTIPKENKSVLLGSEGHSHRSLGRRRHHISWFFAFRHKHEQIVLFRSNKVSKTGIGKEKTKQIAKRTCPSPPRQHTAISVRCHHGNIRRMWPPTSGSSTLLPWFSSLGLFFIPEMKRQWKGRRFQDRDGICAVTEEWL